ncbi:hypothetical protein GCM10009007_11080 [Formosimonas limnophila]|uniref:Uncharacterized protein n=1 Tax=Formosimonas limnophila TaxID=1384487 RepID=A0A8J3FZU7_9BURK|nr:hypothetical protein [Formosimonas limnophila]GHA71937.1 hypothetical protein GCM10009007_11080 [Formosimonas limnophila]
MYPITRSYVELAIKSSIGDLYQHDHHLMAVNSSERSLTHQLAIHLAKYFPNHHVDCEYNRNGCDPKMLRLPVCSNVSSDALDAKTVFPDIVVHDRGNNDNNLLVIEVKKASSSESPEHDKDKLRAFKNELSYQFAFHITLDLQKQKYEEIN